MKEMNNSRKLFTLAGMLILIGSLAPCAFRIASPSGFGPTIQAVSFKRAAALNTKQEYRFNNHGKIVGIPKGVYDKTIGWAYAALAIQFLFWLPAILIIATVGITKAEMSWSGLLYGVPGMIIWIISEFSSPI